MGAALLLAAGCSTTSLSSGSTGPSSTASRSSSSLSASPTPNSPTPSLSPPSIKGLVAFDPARIPIRPPPGGSFLVRGRYPHAPSKCKHPQRPTLHARFPGPLLVRRAEDGTLNVILELPFERYLQGIAEVPPTWPMA